jgi:acetyl/propionyl-CoA carboxylase alpha subunit
MQHEAFTSGNFDTHFVKNYFQPSNLLHENEQEAGIAALVAAKLMQKQTKQFSTNNQTAKVSSWRKNRKV